MNDYVFNFWAGSMGQVGAAGFRGTIQQAVDLYHSYLTRGVYLSSGWPQHVLLSPGQFNVQVQVTNSQTGQIDDAAQKAFIAAVGAIVI